MQIQRPSDALAVPICNTLRCVLDESASVRTQYPWRARCGPAGVCTCKLQRAHCVRKGTLANRTSLCITVDRGIMAESGVVGHSARV